MADHKYVNDGDRPADADRGREGFGDDGGTRVGRPDRGQPAAERAPLHGGGTGRVEGQPGTNTGAVPGGIEGSIESDDAERQGSAQSRVQADAEPKSGDDRTIHDL
jgi:hypothetical protein